MNTKEAIKYLELLGLSFREGNSEIDCVIKLLQREDSLVKMKIIKIKNCLQCPYNSGKTLLEGLSSCRIAGKFGEFLTTKELEDFPDWCPLED